MPSKAIARSKSGRTGGLSQEGRLRQPGLSIAGHLVLAALQEDSFRLAVLLAVLLIVVASLNRLHRSEVWNGMNASLWWLIIIEHVELGGHRWISWEGYLL